ncbi:MAG: hypothetical protein JWR19_3182 [Pedosphaera sp.]|nr:hypothetical protein [Pedosphaera sp.]
MERGTHLPSTNGSRLVSLLFTGPLTLKVALLPLMQYQPLKSLPLNRESSPHPWRDWRVVSSGFVPCLPPLAQLPALSKTCVSQFFDYDTLLVASAG